MKKTYKITLPKDAKVYTIDAKANGGVLNVTVNLEQKYVPKDGDIVTNSIGVIAIYAGTNILKGAKTYTALYEGRLDTDFKPIGWGGISDLRPATEAEKQRLFDALAKEGKRWNAEKKCIENLPRWRAKLNGNFYYINELCCLCTDADEYHSSHNEHYNIGNYFRTREAAEKVAEQIREFFKNSKAE